MTQRTGKSDCKFCIWTRAPDDFWMCLLSVSLWQPGLERQQV